jgi:hypothetical protein
VAAFSGTPPPLFFDASRPMPMCDRPLSFHDLLLSSGVSDSISRTHSMRHTFILPIILITLFGISQLQAQQRVFPNTRDGVHIFYDQLPYNLNSAQLRFAATHFVGCQKMTLDLVRALRSYNPAFIVLNYRLAFGTYDSIDAFVSGNEWINDWDSTGLHPDWFITDAGSPDPARRIRQTDWNWYLMDISGNVNGNRSNGWKEYWTRSVLRQLRDTECDGIFADSFCFPWNLSYTPAWLAPPADVAWIPHMESFGRYAEQQLHGQPERYYFIPNVGPMVTSRDTCDYGAFSDGVMVEFFGSWGPFDLFDLDDWRLQMNRILDLERRGRIVICQPVSSDEWNVQERMFNLVNYLLIKGEHTYYNLVFSENSFDRLIFLPECNVNLGPYTQDPPADINLLIDPRLQAFKRDFANGMVVLNPTWNTMSVSLDKPYYLIDTSYMLQHAEVEIGEDGLPRDSVHLIRVSGNITLPAKSGAVLLNTTVSYIGDPPTGARASTMRLTPPYPNPFTTETSIPVVVPASDRNAQPCALHIIDRFGIRVRTIPVPDGVRGSTHVVWDGRDDSRRLVPFGLYFATTTFRDYVGISVVR